MEELERDRDAGEKEESPFRPYPVENGSDHEENGTNGTGETLSDPLEWCILCSYLFCFLLLNLYSDVPFKSVKKNTSLLIVYFLHS